MSSYGQSGKRKRAERETMTRSQREASSSDIYHVIVRGAGRRLLFEDDEDRRFFAERLFAYAGRAEGGADLLAWCLMENHVHMLLRAPLEALESLMRSLNTSFAPGVPGQVQEHPRRNGCPAARDRPLHSPQS